MERLYWLTEGWYQNISLLPVPCTDSLNSLAEALIYIYMTKSVNEAELFTAFSHTMSSHTGAAMFGRSYLS